MKVLAKPFRDRYEVLKARGVPAQEIAVRAGYFRSKRTSDERVGDVSRLRRNLGLEKPMKNGRQDVRYMDYDVAVKLARAMDMDPHEAGV